MTEEDKYALKELLRGAGVFAGASAVFILILIVLAYFASGGETLKASFEVVDKYDNRCNVIRYTPENSARYVYFLDCEKNK